MLSSRGTSEDEDGEEGESTMPGEYEPWSEAVSRVTPRTPITSRQSSVPRSSRPSPRPSHAINQPIQPKPWPPDVSPVRSHRRRRQRTRRATTPEIIMESHHRHRHRHHRSSEGNRIITIPLDNRPTLGMRGPPRQVLEIERVPCRRRRKHRSCCREIVYDTPPTPYIQPQSNIIYANPSPPSYVLAAQSLATPSYYHNSPSWMSTYSNLTPEIIENLPKQTVHLPPIYLPGSQAYLNTELETVIFPAEIVNPVDGTLSIIQSNPTINTVETAFVQSPSINASPIPQSPTTMLATTSGPFMHQVQDLLQRITLSQSRPIPSSYNQTAMQAPRSVAPQYNPQVIPATTATNLAPYSPTNIRPIVAQNSGPYNTTTFTPAYSRNTSIYPPANITPYRSNTNAQYNSINNRVYQSANTAPYTPANITPYTSLNPTNTSAYQLINSNGIQPYSMDSGSYRNTGITSRPSASNIGPYSPANITPYTSLNPTSTSTYQLINSNGVQSYLMDSGSYRNTSTTSPPSASNIGPYSPANITPYTTRTDRSSHISISPPSIPAPSMSYTGLPSLTSSTSFNSSSSALNERFPSIPHTSLPPNQTAYQSTTAMPKSILRNGSSNRSSSATYTRLNPPNVLSSNVITRELATVV